MTEQELLKKATNFYHKEGNELNAIESFKDLLKLFPTNIDGWTHLATMQNVIKDYDEAIKSINNAIQLAPNNSWIIQQKCTILSLISNLPSEGKMYFNEQTKEAFKIITFDSKLDLLEELDKSLLNVIKLEKENERLQYNYSWKLIHNKFKLGEYENAIHLLKKIKSKIPIKYSPEKSKRELQNIESGITKNLIELKKFNEAIISLKENKKKSDDDYFIGLTLAEIYTKTENFESKQKILLELLKSNNEKLASTPEMAFLNRKFEILKELKSSKQMEELIKDFDLIKNQNDYTIKRKTELESKIKNYLQHRIKNIANKS